MFLLVVCALPLHAQIADSVTLTEIMFDPSGSENTDEFIEIHNFGRVTAVDLTDWLITDNAGGNDSDRIVDAGEGLLLFPGQYAILFDADYDLVNGAYGPLIPDTARVLKIQGSTFGSGGLSNSTSERVSILNTGRQRVSEYWYSLDNGGMGTSDEKIRSDSVNAASNWTNSLYVNGTPGAPPSTNLGLVRMVFLSATPMSGSIDTVTVTVRNSGIRGVESFRIKLYQDLNGNRTADAGEEADSAVAETELERLDSLTVPLKTMSLAEGWNVFFTVMDNVLPGPDTVASDDRLTDSVSAAALMDLAVVGDSLRFSPPPYHAGDAVTVGALIRNEGLTAASGFAVHVYEDADNDRAAEPEEIIDSVQYSGSLTPGDSLYVEWERTNLSKGRHAYFVVIDAASVEPMDDGNPANDEESDSIAVSPSRNAIVISEILYKPSATGTEWIELFNRSGDTLNLRKWKIADEAALNAPKTLTAGDFLLSPQEHLVVGKDSAKFVSSYPGFAARAIFLSTFPTLNDNGDMLLIQDSGGAVIDSLFYDDTWGGGTDLSMERREADAPSFAPSNWGTSEDPSGATPGRTNSLTPLPLDVAVFSNDIRFDPMHPSAGDSVYIDAHIRNAGTAAVDTLCRVYVYFDADRDSQAIASEFIDSAEVYLQMAGDSALVRIGWQVPSIRMRSRAAAFGLAYRIGVRVDYAYDQKLQNNLAFTDLSTSVRAGSLVINEMLYQPDTSQVEFVEVYNRGSTVLDLKDWTVSDLSSSKPITAVSHLLAPGSFRVLAGDSLVFSRFPTLAESSVVVVPGLPSLNNDGDLIVVSDDVGAVVDSVHYYGAWGGRSGVSLERVSYDASSALPANWTSCLDGSGATPGRPNSILSVLPAVPQTIVINEIMSSPFSGEPEYIEIFNRSDSAVDLVHWTLQVGNSKSLLTTRSFPLRRGGYVVLAGQTAFPPRFSFPDSALLVPVDGLPSLINAGTQVALRDPTGRAVDSLYYSPSWGGGDGISLERKKPDDPSDAVSNWGSCVFPEGGTPGEVNSLFVGVLPRRARVSAEPNPFFVDRGETTTIRIDLPVTQARLTVRIYDRQGRLIRTLLNHSAAGSHREVIWDGRDRTHQTARMGVYVIYVEAIDDASGYSQRVKATVVLGRQL
jgi:hypothetical protein